MDEKICLECKKQFGRKLIEENESLTRKNKILNTINEEFKKYIDQLEKTISLMK